MEAVGHKGIGYASIEAAVVGIVCLVIGGHVSGWVHDHKGYLDGLWCMISGLVVLQSLVSDTVKASKERIVGTLVASVLSALVCMLLGYGYLSIFLSISLSVYTMNLLKMESGVRIATATVAVIAGYGFIHPEISAWVNATMRSLDTVIGVGVGVAAVYLSYRLKIRRAYPVADLSNA